MEEYIEKIKKLPDDRLQALIENYRKTLTYLNTHYKQTIQVAMLLIADYTKVEMDKKQAELAILEKLMEERQQAR
ncbi:MAG: hypothetical protein JWP00_977 [Chloroflexi bacterium]|jgi:hypothetical protein|nr:hypothetical protein [Chloroflexota bacterium]